MSIKDLFDNYKSNQFRPSESELSASKLVESNEFIENKFIDKNRYVPPIDFATASNFAKFGSAELYYEFAFKRIYEQYPYDGSLAEKQQFHNDSTFLDKYIFDSVYPKSTGHVIFSSEGWGTQISSSNNYGLSNDVQYISVLGGPHTASGGMIGKELTNTFDNSMIYDVSKSRVGSFEWNPASGSTTEFWMKKGAFLGSSLSNREVILDIWNQEPSSSTSYGRITLELTGTAGPIRLTMLSGTVGFSDLNICPNTLLASDIRDDKWHHYAISIENTGSNVVIDLYRDGRYLHTTTNTPTAQIKTIKQVPNGVNAYIGALQTAVSGTATGRGWGKLSASLDEFRYWKKKRTTNEIGEFWFINMGGGTNNREYNTDMGLYFKFNEGIVGDDTIDSTVLDYSGRISNGNFVGYTSSARSTISAMQSTLVNVEEEKDPIIYPSHPTVSTLLSSYKSTGSIQDLENTSMLYHMMPSWIIEEDESSNQQLRYLTQIMASYFDTLNAQIKGITDFKDKRYFSGSLKPNTYAREILRGQGFVIPNLFIEADILEEIRGKDVNETFDEDIQKIKNKIYQNIYNNLEYIYKSKGTEKSFRNLFRCFGADTELIRLNLYSDGSTYLFKDNYEFTSIAKPVLNLNKELHLTGTVFQSGSNGITYLSQSANSLNAQFTSMTMECEVIFPYKFEKYETGYFSTAFTTSSIAGFHKAEDDPSDFSIPSLDVTLRMYAIKPSVDSRDVTFLLTGSNGTFQIELTSSRFINVYDNNKWILAARLKHENYPFSAVTSSNTGYILEFYGVNSTANDVKNEFLVSRSLGNLNGRSILRQKKRVYAGAHLQNYTGSAIEKSDVKISQVRFWQSYLDNQEIREHSYDPTNYGLIHPYRTDSPFQLPSSDETYVPQIETLALHWDFTSVSSSNSTGNFVVEDISSGSISQTGHYSAIGKITKNKHNGFSHGLPGNSVDVVDKEFIYAAKKRMPDEVYSSDGVVIQNDETENFFQDNDVSDHFYSFEKSPYNAVSQQMINFFGSMMDFSSLVGDPAERYRFEYKQMLDIKKLFFERVENIPDPEKFLEYFKWIDTSISYAITQLIPAGSRFSDGVADIIESHILERNKKQEKFPLIEQQRSTHGVVKSFSEMFYNWKFGHAPLDGSDNKNCIWQKTRRRVADTNVQNLRDNIYKTSNMELDKLYDFATSQTYEGNTDAIRRLTKPYKLDLNFNPALHGGTNYYVAKKRDYSLEVLKPHGPTSGTGIPKNVLVVGVGAGQGLISQTICEDGEDGIVNKEKYSFDVVDGRFSSDQNNAPLSDFSDYKHLVKGITVFPGNIMSQSNAVNTGYQKAVTTNFKNSAYITNIHSDTVDITNEVPMQAPFTERHVGGHQSRHVRLNKYDTSLFDADFGGKPRFYRTVPGTPTIATLEMYMSDLVDADAFTLSDGTTTKSYEVDTLGNGVSVISRFLMDATSTATVLALDFHDSFEYQFDFDVLAEPNDGTGFVKLTITAQNTGSNTIAFTGIPSSMTANIIQAGSAETTQAYYEWVDNKYTRPEAWRMLFGENPYESVVDGAMGLVPPDYGVTAGTGIYPDTAKHRASYYREEKAKRPINVKLIKHRDSGSTVGNYNNNYENMLFQGRKETNLYLRDNPAITNYLPIQYTASLPHTTHVMGLYGIDPTHAGNVWGTHANNMQPDKQLISPAVDGTPAVGEFNVTGATISPRYSSGSFTVVGSRIEGSHASASFSLRKPPIGGNNTYVTFEMGFQTLADEAKFFLGRNGGTKATEVELHQNGHTPGNVPVTPFKYQRAVEIEANTTHRYFGSLETQAVPDATISFYIYTVEGAINKNNTDKYIYDSLGDFNSTKISSPHPVIQLFYTGSTNHLTVRQYIKNHDQTLGYYERKHLTQPQGWYNVIVLGKTPARELNVAVNGILSNQNLIQNNIKNPIFVTGSEHYVMNNHNKITRWGEDVKISDLIYWNSRTGSNTSDQGIVDEIYRGGLKPPDNSLWGNRLCAWHSFGDNNEANPKYIADKSGVSGILTATWDATMDLFTDSNFIFRKSPFVFFSEVADAIKSLNNNGTYFDVQFKQFTSASSFNFQTDWPATSSAAVLTPGYGGSYPQFFAVNSGYDLNYARFFVAAKQESNGAVYQVTPSTSSGIPILGQNLITFPSLDTNNIGSLQINGDIDSIEDVGITIDGTTIKIDHHANSQSGTKVPTYTTTGLCLSGSSSSFPLYVSLNNTTYPSDSTLNGTDKISVSFWHARRSGNAGIETCLLLNATNGNPDHGVLKVITTSPTFSFQVFEDPSTYKTFSVNWTDTHVNKNDLNHYIFTFNASTMSAKIYLNGSQVDSTLLTTVGSATSWNHTITEIILGNNKSTISPHELEGRLAQVALWDKILTNAEASNIYNDGRYKDLLAMVASTTNHLIHWYKLGTEAGFPSAGSNFSSLNKIPDSSPGAFARADLNVFPSNSHWTSTVGLPTDTDVSQFHTDFETAINNTSFNVTSTSYDQYHFGITASYDNLGTVGNNKSLSEYPSDNDMIENLVTLSAGGTDAGGAVDGHYLEINTIIFELDADNNGTLIPAANDIDCDPSVDNTTFWNSLSASIKSKTQFDDITIVDNGDHTATFSITASAANPYYDGQLSKVGSSFTNIVQTAGGRHSAGAVDGDSIVIDGKTFTLDTNGRTDGVPANNYYVDVSEGTPNNNIWNQLSASIKTNTVYDTISITPDTPSVGSAKFSLTSSITGSALNVALSADTPSFNNLKGFVSGSDAIPAVYSTHDVVLEVPTPILRNGDRNRTVIATRFAAPGGIEIESPAYLDIYSREYSVHNGLPYRNLTVKHNSGEPNRIRVVDHLGKRRGLNTLLATHCGKFGLDSQYGTRKVADFLGDNRHLGSIAGSHRRSNVFIGEPDVWDEIIGTGSLASSTWTLAAWINVKSHTLVNRIYDFSDDTVFFVDTTGELALKYKKTDGTFVTLRSNAGITLNKWTFVTVSFDTSDIVNNTPYFTAQDSSVLRGGTTLTPGGSGTPYNGTYRGIAQDECYIGNKTFDLNRSFAGEMAEAMIWTRILFLDQRKAIHDAGIVQGLDALPKSFRKDLQLWYRMGQGYDTNSFMWDQSGNQRHGTTRYLPLTNYIDESVPNYHKVHRNTSYCAVSGNWDDEIALKKRNNNAFFSSPIPASDFQYSWINASLGLAEGIDSGTQMHYRYSPANGVLLKNVPFEHATATIDMDWVDTFLAGGDFDREPATMTINDGTRSVTFEMKDGTNTVSAPNIAINDTGPETLDVNYTKNLRTAIVNSFLDVSVTRVGKVLKLTHNKPGSIYNIEIVSSSEDNRWGQNITGFSGGTDNRETFGAIVFFSASNIT